MMAWDEMERGLAEAQFEWMTTAALRTMLRDTLAHYDDRTDRNFLRSLTYTIDQREKIHGKAEDRGLQAHP